MTTLKITKDQEPRFKKIIKFLGAEGMECMLSAEGLRFRNGSGSGIVSREFFKDYDIVNNKVLGYINKKQAAAMLDHIEELEDAPDVYKLELSI